MIALLIQGICMLNVVLAHAHYYFHRLKHTLYLLTTLEVYKYLEIFLCSLNI